MIIKSSHKVNMEKPSYLLQDTDELVGVAARWKLKPGCAGLRNPYAPGLEGGREVKLMRVSY